MNNQKIAGNLRAVAAAYEVKGKDPFRIRAYQNAADSVEHASREVKDLWEEGKLSQLPGVGANIAKHLDELFKTGKVTYWQKTFKSLPGSMFKLLEVPGIGPKTAFKLSKELKLSEKKAVSNLKKAALNKRIETIEGFGKESQQVILKGIEEYQRRENRMLLPKASAIANDLINYMQTCKEVIRIDPLGSLRRRSPTIGDIDFAVATEFPKIVVDHFTKYSKVNLVLAAGELTSRVKLTSGEQVDLKVQNPETYGALLQHFTGSKNHNISLRERVLKKEMSLSEHGIKVKGKLRKFADEKQFYNSQGLDWIPPELREDRGEIQASQKHKLPKLVKLDQIKGDLHLHTNFGWRSSHDAGENSMREMITKAIKLGYKFVGIGDHNPSKSFYSNKQLISQVKKRSDIVSKLKSSKAFSNIEIFNTLEVDILSDGSLAIPDKALQTLDFAVVSIHSSMRISKSRMTARVLKGLSHPKAKILGHPTGRLLNKREGFELDWQKLFTFVKKENKFLEINAWPNRLDLPDTLVKSAIEHSVQLVINTDAHSQTHLELMQYGVDVARRGWAQEKDIINTLPTEKLKNKLKI